MVSYTQILLLVCGFENLQEHSQHTLNKGVCSLYIRNMFKKLQKKFHNIL